MRRRFLLIALAALAGCSHDEHSKVDAAYYGRAELPPSGIALHVRAASAVWTFYGSELAVEGLTVRTPTVSTATGGPLDVSFVLAATGGEASRGAISLDLRRDWGWGISISVDSANPTRFCLGCMGAQSFPLAAAYRRSAKDSVWMVWGGNSIAHPVVY